MEVTDVRITLENKGLVRAKAIVVFDDCFIVRGLKVIDGDNGFFVAMPSRRGKNGKPVDVAHPINNATRLKIEDAVITAYEKVRK